MKRKRRHLTAEFKARVAAVALKGEKSIQQIAQDNDIAPSQVSTWKKDLEDHMPSIFERKNAADQSAEKQERRTSHLERKIGQLITRERVPRKKVRSAGNRSERKAMIDPSDKKISLRKQAKLLGINRNRLTPRQSKTTEEDRKIMTVMDELYMECPFYGQRNLRENLRDHGYHIGRKRVRRLMRIMGIEALVPKPSTSVPTKGHEIFPYLLRHREINTVDEVWCADITYIPMQKGHAYLVAIMDWHSRAVLAWEISNTMDTAFCVRALKEALRRTGRTPKIFNTDQGSQFTGKEWISELQKQGIQISMDGRGRWMDNVFIERLWRSLKYEKLRLWSYQTISELRALTTDWMEFYNHRRKHQAHGYHTPWSVYQTPVSQAA